MLTEVPVEPLRKLTEGNRRSHECWQKFLWNHSESWLKVTESLTIAWDVNGSSRERTNVDWSLQKVLRSHRKLKDGSSAARKVQVGLQKVLRTHEKLTEYPADALKLDGWYRSHTESFLRLSGRSSFRTKCFPQTDKKLMEVDGRSREQMESWWNVSLTNIKLTNVDGNPAAAWIFDGCSHGRIES